MLLKSCTSCHVLLSDVFSHSVPLRKEKKSCRRTQSWVKKLDLSKEELVYLFFDAIFEISPEGSNQVFLTVVKQMHVMHFPSLCNVVSPSVISCVTVNPASSVKVLLTNYEDRNLLVKYMMLPLIASQNQHYIHSMAML